MTFKSLKYSLAIFFPAALTLVDHSNNNFD